MAVSQTLTVTELSYNVADNTSKVRILWQSTQTGESHNDYTRTATYYVIINGGVSTEYSVSYTLPQSSTKTILDTTITVPHNNDGTGTIAVITSMDTGISAGVIQKSSQIALTTIPRASTIISASDAILGNKCAVKWTPLSKTYRYRLTFSLGSWSETTEVIHPNTTSAYTYTEYTIPVTVASQFGNDAKATMTVTLYTYSDSGATVQGGSASSKTFTVQLPNTDDVDPIVTMSLAPVNSIDGSLASLYIQGKTKVQTTISAQGTYGATISSYALIVEGKTYGSPYQSDYLSQSGYVTVRGRAYDNRGNSGDAVEDIYVIPYSKPKLLPASNESSIICARCNEKGELTDSGTYLKIKASRSYSKVEANSEQNNFCAIRYRYRQEGANEFSDWITLLAKDNLSTDTINSDPIANVVSSTEASYVVQIGVIDDLGENANIQFIVPTDFVTVDIPEDLKGKSIGIFRHAAAHNDGKNHIDINGFVHGGGVDNLTISTRLTASSESRISLDDLKIPGNYYSPDKETTQYISGTPSNVDFGFGLEVREMQSKDNIRQTLYYGITSWYRHWNGQEWSGWVSSLMGVSDEVTAHDFVVDSGTSGVWKYRLWQSGEAELWGVITLKTFGDVRHIREDVGLPFPFAEYPTVNITLSQAVAYTYTQGTIILSEVYELGKSIIRLMMIRDEGGLASGNTCKVSVAIKGKWK